MLWLCQLGTAVALMFHVPQLACTGGHPAANSQDDVASPSLRFAQSGQDDAQGGLIIVPLPSDRRVIADTHYAVVTLEHGPSENLAFCNAIVDKKPAKLLSYSALAPAVIYWPIRISEREYEEKYKATPSCGDLIEIYDFDDAWKWQDGFDVSQLAGPRVISFDPVTKRSIFLDFSGYPAPVFVEAIDKWKKSIWDNKSVREVPSADWVKTEITSLYWTEYSNNPRLLQFSFQK